MSYRFYRNITSAFIFSSLIFSQNMPSWIVDMPKDISYYWARESIEKKGLAEDDYKEKVNNRAIKTLSMQINARIASSTESNLNETNFTVQSEFSQSLSMSTMSDIDGAEKYADLMMVKILGTGDSIKKLTKRISKEQQNQQKVIMNFF